jgi:hypothetical protein
MVRKRTRLPLDVEKAKDVATFLMLAFKDNGTLRPSQKIVGNGHFQKYLLS